LIFLFLFCSLASARVHRLQADLSIKTEFAGGVKCAFVGTNDAEGQYAVANLINAFDHIFFTLEETCQTVTPAWIKTTAQGNNCVDIVILTHATGAGMYFECTSGDTGNADRTALIPFTTMNAQISQVTTAVDIYYFACICNGIAEGANKVKFCKNAVVTGAKNGGAIGLVELPALNFAVKADRTFYVKKYIPLITAVAGDHDLNTLAATILPVKAKGPVRHYTIAAGVIATANL